MQQLRDVPKDTKGGAVPCPGLQSRITSAFVVYRSLPYGFFVRHEITALKIIRNVWRPVMRNIDFWTKRVNITSILPTSTIRNVWRHKENLSVDTWALEKITTSKSHNKYYKSILELVCWGSGIMASRVLFLFRGCLTSWLFQTRKCWYWTQSHS